MKKELKLKKLKNLTDCFSLESKTVVIVGGLGNLAQSFIEVLLSAECAHVIIVDKKTAGSGQKITKMRTSYPHAHIDMIACDITNNKDIKRLHDVIQKKYKSIHVLIYSVMAKPKNYYAPVSKYSKKTWDTVLDGNVGGAFGVVQYMEPLLQNGGSVIFVGSIYGISAPDFRIYKKSKKNIYGGTHPLGVPASYAASKAGLIGLGKYFSVHLAERDIRVNTLVPGGIYDGQDNTFYKEYVKRVPLKRMATWSDFNGAVVFLASDASRYMTGQTLIIDGGWTAW